MNVQKYLERIKYHGTLTPNLQALFQLQTAHTRTVPFENLSVYFKEPIQLDEEWMYEKIVDRNRGGFCYELNGLFAWLLRSLGYRVDMLSAGVARKDGGFGPEFDHMTLLVHLEEDYLVDVGFGDSFEAPLRIKDRGKQRQNGMSYQIKAEDEALILFEQNDRDENPSMLAQYRFTLTSRRMEDYENMCLYHQSSPESSFTQKRVCSRATPNGRVTLSGMKFIVTENGVRNERELSSEREYEAILLELFNIRL
jgi:N-hydroxyarylamine O-acetyltransferase